MSQDRTEPKAEAPPSPLADLLTLDELQQQHERVFPSPESLRWYVRQHRKGLEDAGALLFIGGRLWARPGPFAAYVVEAGQKAVQRRAVPA